LCVTVSAPVDIEDQNGVGFDQSANVEEIHKNRVLPHEDMRNDNARVELAEISRQQTVLEKSTSA